MADDLPAVTRTYRSWSIDSTRWQRFDSRPDDIVVATPYKSGTTWMIHIVGQIIFNDLTPRDHKVFGRWPDSNFRPFDEDARDLAAMNCRRVMKTHLALDGLPYDSDKATSM
jgi:aryl sulfotransferase